MVFRWIVFLGAVISFASAEVFASAGITYHGRLVDPSGHAVEATTVQFKIQLRTPGSENCLLYEEVHTRNMSGSNGVFAITVNDGTASQVNVQPFTLDRVFQNRGTFSFGTGKCAIGNSYVPNATDGRKLVVEFNDGSFTGWEALPAQSVNYVPMAIESMTVGGFGKESLLRVLNGAGEPASVPALTDGQYNSLTSLIAGTSSAYLTSSSSLNGANLAAGSVDDSKLASGISGSKITGAITGNAAGFTGTLAGDVTGTQGATSVVKLRGRDIDTTPPAADEVLKWNGTSLRWEPGTDNVGITTELDPTVPANLKDGVDWSEVGSKPTTFTPSAHNHTFTDLQNGSGVYLDYRPNNTSCTTGETLKWNNSQNRWECGADLGLTSAVTSLTVNAPIVNSGTATAPVLGVSDASTSAKGVVQLAANGGTTAGTAVQADDARLSDARTPTAHSHPVDQVTSAAGKYFGYQPNGAACSDQQILKWNGSQNRWECGTDAGGSGMVASVAVNAPIVNSGTASAMNLSISDASTSAKGIVQLATSAQVSAGLVVQASDTRLSDARTPTAHTHPVDEITSAAGKYLAYQPNGAACSANQVLKWVNSRWECAADDNIPTNFGIGDLKTSLGAAQFTQASCAANQTLTWSALTDAFTCANINNLNANTITAGTIAAARLGSGIANATTYLRGDGTWAAVTSAPWTESGGNVYRSAGSVGVGTTSPNASALLELSSTSKGLLLPRMTTAQKNAIISPAQGLAVYDTTLNQVSLYTGSSWTNTTTSTGVVAFKVEIGSGGGVTLTGPADYAPNSVLIDTHSAWNNTCHCFVAPESGYYNLGWHFYTGTPATVTRRVYLYVDAGSGFNGVVTTGDSNATLNASTVVYLSAGDKAKLFVPSGYQLDTYGAGGHNGFWGVKIGSTGGAGGGADNLGNHVATQKLDLGGNQLVGNGGSTGLAISNGGSVGVGTVTPDGSALLDVTSTSKGFLPPRMTTAQRDAIPSPSAGLTIFNTTTNLLQVFDGTTWGNSSGSATQEVVQGASVNLPVTGTWADIVSLTVTTGGKYLVLASGNTSGANPWAYFSSACYLMKNGSQIDYKYFYYGTGGGGSSPGVPQTHYSLQTLATGDVLKARCSVTSDGPSASASNWKISLMSLGISNLSGADDLGSHTATQNLNLGVYQLVGNGGSGGIAIANSGRVGVGTASPEQKLHVAGYVKADGLLPGGSSIPSHRLVFAQPMFSHASATALCTSGRAISVPQNYQGRTGTEICAADTASDGARTTCTGMKYYIIRTDGSTTVYPTGDKACSTSGLALWPYAMPADAPNSYGAEWFSSGYVVCCN